MNMDNNTLKGSQILLESLQAHGVDTIFGYPGGAIMPVYDALMDQPGLRHILVRHEQGAIHSAQGYARVKNTAGVVLVTSGPGATNVMTGIADAMTDSTPLVIIAGQVPTSLLGTDGFQETDFVDMTSPITKWTYQIRRAEDVAWAVARAFYIATSGRPGPVVLDFTKDAQVGMAEYKPVKCDFIRSYVPSPVPSDELLRRAARMIDEAQRPFVLCGHGVEISGAEKNLKAFLDKGDIPAGSTLLALSVLDSNDPHYKGMLGMHGSIASNIMTQNCDLLIAVGMRFDDRVTGNLATYAKQAAVIHIDIDPSEINKTVDCDLGIVGDAAYVLDKLTSMISVRKLEQWNNFSIPCNKVENEKVSSVETNPGEGPIKPGEVVARVADYVQGSAIVITDVGQNQMLGARYSRFARERSFISSGGLGTMGFGLPAAIGAKIAAPDRKVCLFVGDGGLQMTIEELGTIMQERLGVKIVLLDNTWLGNVRQWQELFFNKRYSYTKLLNPDFEKIAQAYDIDSILVQKREELVPAIEKMFSNDRATLLHVMVQEENMVFPMIAPGKSVDEILLNTKEYFEYGD